MNKLSTILIAAVASFGLLGCDVGATKVFPGSSFVGGDVGITLPAAPGSHAGFQPANDPAPSNGAEPYCEVNPATGFSSYDDYVTIMAKSGVTDILTFYAEAMKTDPDVVRDVVVSADLAKYPQTEYFAFVNPYQFGPNDPVYLMVFDVNNCSIGYYAWPAFFAGAAVTPGDQGAVWVE